MQCSKPERAERCVSDAYYWNGYHWSALVAKQGNDVGVFLVCSVGRKQSAPDRDREPTALYDTEVYHEVYLSRGATDDCLVDGKHRFVPTHSTFQAWGCAPVTHPSAAGREALSWDAFWGDASPYCRDGAVRGRFALSVPKGS